jgi:DNA modification methylase
MDIAYKLHEGDCIEYMRQMEAGSVDCVITDPPYGMKKADWDMQIIDPLSWLPKFRNVALFCGVKGLHDYPKSDWTMAWVRLGSTQRNGSYGGFNNWEPILIYGFKGIANDVISVANVPDNTINHPTSKPIKLMRQLIERLTNIGDVVFDPFMGSGTTGVACIELGRRFIGCEINPEYFAIAKRRIEQAALQPTLWREVQQVEQLSMIEPAA